MEKAITTVPDIVSVLVRRTGSADGRFDYASPATGGTPRPGDLVAVPFRSGTTTGIVWPRTETESAKPQAALKAVERVMRPGLLPAYQIKLAQWIADYYFSPLAKVVEGMIPERLSTGRFDPVAHRPPILSPGATLPRGKRQAEVWEAVRSSAPISLTQLKDRLPWVGKAFIERMIQAGIVQATAGMLPAPTVSTSKANPAKTLTTSQAAALRTIHDQGPSKPFLLFGPPASGKTEIYLQQARRATSSGRQALVLVPEIALTPGLTAYFATNFGTRLSIIHSRLSETERCIEWERLRCGEADVAIGSRIALFAPFRDLGCICVDEEHEWTYKSEQTPRYHARDVAIKLGELTGSTVMLGSATPSIESFAYAKLGKYELVRLQRIGGTEGPLSAS